MFLRNVGHHSTSHTASLSRRDMSDKLIDILQRDKNFVRFDVFTMGCMNIPFFWDMTSFNLVERIDVLVRRIFLLS